MAGCGRRGWLAAAGSYALVHQVEWLVEDHRRAGLIADALGVGPVETIIVPIDLTGTAQDGPQLAAATREQACCCRWSDRSGSGWLPPGRQRRRRHEGAGVVKELLGV